MWDGWPLLCSYSVPRGAGRDDLIPPMLRTAGIPKRFRREPYEQKGPVSRPTYTCGRRHCPVTLAASCVVNAVMDATPRFCPTRER